MNRTSTIRAVAMTLALVSSAASTTKAQYRSNVALARADTSAPIKRASVADSSTVARAPEQYSVRPSNFYVGFAAGANMPSGEFGNAYENGWSVAVPMGWRPANGPLGMRLDVAYSKWAGATLSGVKLNSAAVWDGMLDATVDMPFGANKLSSFYLLGGGGLHYFPKYGGEYSVSQPTAGDTTTPPPTGGYPKSTPS